MSIALKSSMHVVGTSSGAPAQSGGGTPSGVFGSQSSSTRLPITSIAPGFTSAGSLQSAGVSQQSPSATVQPSPSASATAPPLPPAPALPATPPAPPAPPTPAAPPPPTPPAPPVAP